MTMLVMTAMVMVMVMMAMIRMMLVMVVMLVMMLAMMMMTANIHWYLLRANTVLSAFIYSFVLSPQRSCEVGPVLTNEENEASVC